MLLLKATLIAVPLIVVLDLLWLGVVMKEFYRLNLGHLMGREIVWGAAIAFYLLFALGLSYFVVISGLGGTLLKTFFLGAFFGLVAYGTYDLTNYATLRDWPLIVTVVDMVWGALLSGAVTVAVVLVLRWL